MGCNTGLSLSSLRAASILHTAVACLRKLELVELGLPDNQSKQAVPRCLPGCVRPASFRCWRQRTTHDCLHHSSGEADSV